MRKLLVFFAVMLIAGAVSAIGVSITKVNMDYTTVSVVFSISDTSALGQRYLYWGTGATGGLSLKDSITSGYTQPDTFAITGLMNGATYRFRIDVYDTLGVKQGVSLIYTVITTDLVQTISDSGSTHEGATVLWNGVEADTGIAKVRLYVYNVSDSLWAAGLTDSLVPRMTVTETLTVSWDTTVVNPLNSDSVFLAWDTNRDSVAAYVASVLTDSSTGDSASVDFSKTTLQPLTWYYYAGIVCSADVYDSLAIDSIYSSALADTFFAVTGLQEGETYYYGTTALDSALTDTSDIESFSTTNYQTSLAITPTATLTSITVTATTNTSYDFNGTDSVNLFEGYTADSLTDVATLTLAETLTVSWDSTVIIAADSVFFFWGTNRDSVLELNGNYATDTTLTQTYTDDFIKTGLGSVTKYYYSTIACSADVYDTVAIDSVTTGTLASAIFSRTGKFRGSRLYYWAQCFDSIYCDSTTTSSYYIPELDDWDRCDLQLNWTQASALPHHIVDVDGIETFYYRYYYTGGTFVTDSLKLFAWDITTGTAIAMDSSGLITLDSGTVALDSINCQGAKKLKIGMVYRGGGTAATTNIGLMNLYIWTQKRPF